jgi:hypothetical protein
MPHSRSSNFSRIQHKIVDAHVAVPHIQTQVLLLARNFHRRGGSGVEWHRLRQRGENRSVDVGTYWASSGIEPLRLVREQRLRPELRSLRRRTRFVWNNTLTCAAPSNNKRHRPRYQYWQVSFRKEGVSDEKKKSLSIFTVYEDKFTSGNQKGTSDLTKIQEASEMST